jgi:hypothetical protein
MALTQAQRHSFPAQHTKSAKRPLAKCPTPLVPEAKVKKMLQEIAYVLDATRRLAKEIRDEDCPEVRKLAVGSLSAWSSRFAR